MYATSLSIYVTLCGNVLYVTLRHLIMAKTGIRVKQMGGHSCEPKSKSLLVNRRVAMAIKPGFNHGRPSPFPYFFLISLNYWLYYFLTLIPFDF